MLTHLVPPIRAAVKTETYLAAPPPLIFFDAHIAHEFLSCLKKVMPSFLPAYGTFYTQDNTQIGGLKRALTNSLAQTLSRVLGFFIRAKQFYINLYPNPIHNPEAIPNPTQFFAHISPRKHLYLESWR